MTIELRPDVSILHYRLLAAVGHEGGDVWRAEDTRSGRTVALKVLSRSAPIDKGRRAALLSKLRQAAAFVHPAFPTMYEITATDDGLLVAVMEWIDGETVTQKTSRGPVTREQLVKFGYQLAEALGVMHKHELIHGNFSPDNILIDTTGNLRLLGLTASALSDRRERSDVSLVNSENDLEALSYRSPEELNGRAVDKQSDVFSFGAVFYRLATGSAPFTASSVHELPEVISKNNPRNPMELNAQLERPLFQIIGKSIFKNSQARYIGFDPVLADFEKLEPKVRTLAAYPKSSKTEKPIIRTMSNIFIAELPYYELLSKKEPGRAVQLSAKMQQLVGEAVYLFDGEVLDSIGPRMVAIIPDPHNAIRAARRTKADLLEYNSEHANDGGAIEPRMVLHRDEIVRRDLTLEGKGVDLLTQLVGSLEPGQMLLSEALLRAAHEETPAAGDFGGVKFCHLPAEPESEGVEPALPIPPAMPVADVKGVPAAHKVVPQQAAGEAVSSASSDVPLSPRKKSIVPVAAAVGIIALLGAGAAAFYFSKSKSAEVATTQVAAPATVQASLPKLFIDSFASASPDAAVAANAAALAPAIAELLRQSGKIEISSTAEGSEHRLTMKPAADPAAGVIPQMSGKGDGPALQLQDRGAAATQLVTWVGQVLNVPTATLVSTQPGAMDSFARAAAQYRSSEAAQQKMAQTTIAEAVLRDPNFVPAQRLALEIFSASGNRRNSISAAERLIALNVAEPAIFEKLLVWKIEEGRAVDAISQAAAMIAKNPSDLVALQTIARYSLSAGDEKTFQKAVQKVESLATAEDEAFVHRADIFAVAGDHGRAANAYYDIELKEPNNAAVAFKIGRIAALRESWQIADIELKKLQRLSPNYGAPMLEAFIATKKKENSKVEPLLQRAIAGATWHDDVLSHAAEIYALRSQRERVIETLERALVRGEASLTAVLLKQPFYYIGYDARSSKLKKEMEEQRDNLRRALSTVRL